MWKEKKGLKGAEEVGGTVSKTVSTAVKRGKIQNSNHLNQFKACGTINISKYWITFKVQTLQFYFWAL